MRNTTAMILVSALLGGCSTDLVDLSWNGPGQIGTIRSAEWIRYKTTSDITFTGELTLNFFVLTDQEDFCTSYQDAVGSTFGAFEAFEAARQPYEDADDLRNPALCELTRDYYLALGDAVDGLTQPGRLGNTDTTGPLARSTLMGALCEMRKKRDNGLY